MSLRASVAPKKVVDGEDNSSDDGIGAPKSNPTSSLRRTKLSAIRRPLTSGSVGSKATIQNIKPAVVGTSSAVVMGEDCGSSDKDEGRNTVIEGAISQAWGSTGSTKWGGGNPSPAEHTEEKIDDEIPDDASAHVEAPIGVAESESEPMQPASYAEDNVEPTQEVDLNSTTGANTTSSRRSGRAPTNTTSSTVGASASSRGRRGGFASALGERDDDVFGGGPAVESKSPADASARQSSPAQAPPSQQGSPTLPLRHVPTAVPKYDFDTAVTLLTYRSGPGAGFTAPSISNPSASAEGRKRSTSVGPELASVKEAAQKAKDAAKAYFEQIAGTAANTSNASRAGEESAKTDTLASATSPVEHTQTALQDTPAPKIQELLTRPMVRVVEFQQVHNETSVGIGNAQKSASGLAYEPPSQRLAALHNAATRLSYSSAQHLYEVCLGKNIVAPLAANTFKCDQHAKYAAHALRDVSIEANAMASLAVTIPIWF